MLDNLLDEFYEIALEQSSYSNCSKMKYGAVMVNNVGMIISLGYNHSVVPELCCLRKGVTSGTRHEMCGAVHAEQAAVIAGGYYHGPTEIILAGRYPDGKEWLYSEYYCTTCARIMKETNVQGIYVIGAYHKMKWIDINSCLDQAYKWVKKNG